MAILKIRDENGAVIEVTAIVGPKGEPGEQGAQGPQGEPGEKGYTPVKGADYFTEADKAEIVSAVLEQFADVSEVAL